MSRTFLGQNFLIDEAVKSRIVELFHPPGLFGEVGPGEGAITELLAKKYSKFLAFEKDPQMIRALEAKNILNIEIVRGDFSNWRFEVDGLPVNDFSLIGNLPYEVGTRILKSVCAHAEQIVHFLFMLQREVVQRIVAKPATGDFGSLSVLVQGQYELEALDLIRPEAFRPAPKVVSQLIRGRLRWAGRHPLSEDFQKFVQLSFLQKRKILQNSWKSRFERSRIEAAFAKFNLSPKTRAEELPLDLWPPLFEEMKT